MANYVCMYVSDNNALHKITVAKICGLTRTILNWLPSDLLLTQRAELVAVRFNAVKSWCKLYYHNCRITLFWEHKDTCRSFIWFPIWFLRFQLIAHMKTRNCSIFQADFMSIFWLKRNVCLLIYLDIQPAIIPRIS